MKALRGALIVVALFTGFAWLDSTTEAATKTGIYSFSIERDGDGHDPYSRLLYAKGLLYGTTYYGDVGTGTDSGTLFSVDPHTSTETVLHSFVGGADGSFPITGLINVKGTFYGTTSLGGGCSNFNGGCGTVFAFNPSTGAETVVYSFQGGTDGYEPFADLIYEKGKLYGTTYGGGTSCGFHPDIGCGTAYSLDIKTGIETVLHAFQGGTADGAYPYAALTDVSGTFYGTTYQGGSNSKCTHGCGTIFAIDPATGAEKLVYVFKGSIDGAYPEAGLIDVNGTLYGTTAYGGHAKNCLYGCGTIFAFNPSTAGAKVLYHFHNDGVPTADLLNVDGRLYGTTSGGTSCCGTVFSFDLKTGAETLVYAFGVPPDGSGPWAPLIDVKGALYGTTVNGGNGAGTVFSITR